MDTEFANGTTMMDTSDLHSLTITTSSLTCLPSIKWTYQSEQIKRYLFFFSKEKTSTKYEINFENKLNGQVHHARHEKTNTLIASNHKPVKELEKIQG